MLQQDNVKWFLFCFFVVVIIVPSFLPQMNVSKDEDCILVDNSNRMKWRVVNRMGVEGTAPGICFVIPPPNHEAIEYAAK